MFAELPLFASAYFPAGNSLLSLNAVRKIYGNDYSPDQWLQIIVENKENRVSLDLLDRLILDFFQDEKRAGLIAFKEAPVPSGMAFTLPIGYKLRLPESILLRNLIISDFVAELYWLADNQPDCRPLKLELSKIRATLDTILGIGPQGHRPLAVEDSLPKQFQYLNGLTTEPTISPWRCKNMIQQIAYLRPGWESEFYYPYLESVLNRKWKEFFQNYLNQIGSGRAKKLARHDNTSQIDAQEFEKLHFAFAEFAFEIESRIFVYITQLIKKDHRLKAPV